MNDHKNNRHDELEHAVRDLSKIGKSWAAYGLNAGRAALETSASTLRTTADVLGRLSTVVEESRVAEAEEQPSVDDPATDE